jgi:hypothetical protein
MLLAMLLLGADCACASLHYAEEATHIAAASAPAQCVRAVKPEASILSAPSHLNGSRSACMDEVLPTMDVLSRRCALLI